MPPLGSYIEAVIGVVSCMCFGAWVFIRAHRDIRATCCCREVQQVPSRSLGRALLCCYLSLIGTCMLGSVLLLYLLGSRLKIDWLDLDSSVLVSIVVFWVGYTGVACVCIIVSCNLLQKCREKPLELSSDENVVQE
jgi:hypothetical protein